jgi:hypothetical protein
MPTTTPPPVRVREVLEAARRSGVPFGQAWPAALDAVEDDRWLEALAQTAGTWKRAYALEPVTTGETAIDLLSRGLAGELANLEALAHCPVCDARIRPQKWARREQVYCSSRCLKVAWGRSHPKVDVAA